MMNDDDYLSTDNQLSEAITKKLLLNVSISSSVQGGDDDDDDEQTPLSCDALEKQHASLPATMATASTTGNRSTQATALTQRSLPIILCDMTYGLPREARPRKEKILAISRQLVNFLKWQTTAEHHQHQQQHVMNANMHSFSTTTTTTPYCYCCCEVRVVACPDQTTADALQKRMLELWNNVNNERHQHRQDDESLPSHFSITTQPLEDWMMMMTIPTTSVAAAATSAASNNNAPHSKMPVYLSPDAKDVLDIHQDPPPIVVIGLLIDRRIIQLNRSVERASKLEMPVARWPLETVSDVLDRNEPLNVDCILEGMQQWYWNCAQLDHYANNNKDDDDDDDSEESKDKVNSKLSLSPSLSKARCFQDAAIQALQHHQERHPERPQHIIHKDNNEC